MDSKSNNQRDYDQPVAYDKDGNPLYAHPTTPNSNRAQVVQMTRSSDPQKMVVSPATQLKHDRSVEAYPGLNLSEGEYIISEVKRHTIGLVPPFAVGAFVMSLALILLFNYQAILKSIQVQADSINPLWIILSILGFIVLILIGMYTAYYVFINNRFYLTNESIIQEIQSSLFFRSEQTISLLNIEDASFAQKGILQGMFNFGSIRLRTEGDESTANSTFRLSYVSSPKETIAQLNNAIEAFKNGRPIEDNNN